MELPFLKRKNKTPGGSIMMSQTIEGDDSQLRRAIAREMWEAIEKKDETSFLSAFEALVLNIKDEDENKDEEME